MKRPHLAGPAEGNWRTSFPLGGGLLQSFARLLGPRTVGRVTQVERPLFVSGFAFAAFFVGEREIEMNVRMGGHRAGGAAEVINGFIELAEFL